MLTLLFATAVAGNLIKDGNFSNPSAKFITDYQRAAEVSAEGSYTITGDTLKAHSGAWKMPAHGGRGRMLMANGSLTEGATVWGQDVMVSPKKTYTFTGWGASWSKGWMTQKPKDDNPARLVISINGKQLGSPVVLSEPSGEWTKFVFVWNAGTAKKAKIRIVDASIENIGNDFAIDDLAFHVK